LFSLSFSPSTVEKTKANELVSLCEEKAKGKWNWKKTMKTLSRAEKGKKTNLSSLSLFSLSFLSSRSRPVPATARAARIDALFVVRMGLE
jgi:hypothetical protein